MKTRHKPLRAIQRRGATTIEMAVVVPVFFLFAFALIEFSRISMVKQSLNDAAQAGCRKAILATTRDQQDVETTVRNHLQSVLSDSTQVGMCNVSISHSDLGNVERGTEITTTVEVNCSDVSWIAPDFGEDVMIRAASTMKRE